MKESGFARKSESFLQIPIKLVIKLHISKAFALTGLGASALYLSATRR